MPALLEDDLDAIVLKALRREPDRRYPGAAALGEDLRRHLAGLRVEARPDTFSYRAGKFVRRHRGGVAAAALTLLALLAGLAGTTWQARRAQANARRAERVQEFLVRLFQGSDPSRSRGENVSARDLLADGTRRIEGELRGEPEVQAALYDVVAQIHRSLGSIPESQRLAERSLAERRRIYGADSPVTAESRLTLAEARYCEGRGRGRGEPSCAPSFPVLSAAYGADSMETIRARDTIAAALLDEGKVPAALAMMQDVVASRRRRFGPDHPETGAGMHLLGQMQEAANRYAEAAVAYRAAVDTLARALGADNPQTAAARYSLAQALAYVGKRDEGEKQFQQALAAQRKSLGDHHPETGQTLIALGLLYINERRYPEADAAFTEALGIFQPLGHFDAGTCLRMLGPVADGAGALRRGGEAVRGGPRRLAREARRRRTSSRSRRSETSATCTCASASWTRRNHACARRSRGWRPSSAREADQLRAPLNQLGEVLRAAGTAGRGDGAASPGARDPAEVGRRGQPVGRRHPLPARARSRWRKGDAASLAEARGLLDAAIAVQRKADAEHPRLDDMLLASGRVARAQGDAARAGRTSARRPRATRSTAARRTPARGRPAASSQRRADVDRHVRL